MKNYVQEGDYIDVEAPVGGVSSGDLVVIGSLIGVAVTDADAGDSVSLAMEGVFDLAKSGDTGPAFSVGDYVYSDGTDITDDDTDTAIGVCVVDAGASDTTVRVRLNVGAVGPQGPQGDPG